MRIGIVTDSTADIPVEDVSRHHIKVVPAILVIEGQSFADGNDISRTEFYDRMPHMRTPPTTATPSVGTFQSVYETMLKEGLQTIFSLHVASPLSGIFNTAKMAAQSFGERVKVIDSGSISMGLGFQVIAAAVAAARGLSPEAIEEHIEQVRQKIRVIAMFDTLEHIRRSGRVSWVTARIGSLLRVKLFVEVLEGAVLNLGQTRTRRKGIAHLKSLIEKLENIHSLAILHSNAEEDARQMLADLNLQLPTQPYIVNTTPVIGTHVGPNGLGFAVIQG